MTDRKPAGMEGATEVVLAEKPSMVEVAYHTVGRRIVYRGDIEKLVRVEDPGQQLGRIDFTDGRSATFLTRSSNFYWPGKPNSL